MSTLIPLPHVDQLPDVIVFHRDHPSAQRLMIQLPTGQDEAETYVIRLDQPKPEPGAYDPRTDHKGWMQRLPNSQALMDLLSYEMHVAYYPNHGGAVMMLEDPDEVSWVRQAFEMAHMAGGGGLHSLTTRAPAPLRARTMPLPPLRTALGGRVPRGRSW